MELYPALLARIARALDGAGIPYMVIGGQAVLLHGEPRLTRDIDLTLGCDAGQLDRLLSITSAADLQPAVTQIEAFVKQTNVLPLTDRSSEIRVDMIFSFTPYEANAILRSLAVPLGGSQREDKVSCGRLPGRSDSPRKSDEAIAVTRSFSRSKKSHPLADMRMRSF